MLAISCSTSSEKLKDKNPQLYNQIVGKPIYILSHDKYGYIENSIIFKDNNTIEVYAVNNKPNTNQAVVRKGQLKNSMTNNFAAADSKKTEEMQNSTIISYSGVSSQTNKQKQAQKPPNRGVGKWSKLEAYEWSYLEGDTIRLQNKENKKDTVEITFTLNTMLCNDSFSYQEIGNVNTMEYDSRCYMFLFDENVLTDFRDNYVKRANEAWTRVNKKSCAAIVEYLIDQRQIGSKHRFTIPNEDKAYDIFDQKVIAYLSSKYPRFKKYFSMDISNLEYLRFHDIFHALIIPKDTMPVKFDITYDRDNDINVRYTWGTGKALVFYFRASGNKFSLVGMSDGGPLWSLMAGDVLAMFTGYPSFENIDTDFLDKIR